MAELKRQTFHFTNGKQIKLHGNSFFINRSLEIGEGSVPNIFFLFQDLLGSKTLTSVSNPYKLTAEELMELADYNSRLWLELKEAIRKHGITSPGVFNGENVRPENDNKGTVKKKETDKSDNSKEI
jgi:hypothetical protein